MTARRALQRAVRDIVLSGERPDVEQTFRDGALRVFSRRGLRPTEALLLEALPKDPPRRVLAGFDTEGAVALAAAALYPSAEVFWRHFDAYVATKVGRVARRNGAGDRLDAKAAADLPGFVGRGGSSAAPFDVVALPAPEGLEGLLVRELAEEAHDVLAVGGVFLCGTDGDPTRLRDVIKSVFGKADAMRTPKKGAVVRATRMKAAAAWKEHAHVLTVPFAGRTLELETRPGTFSYGKLDRGTKALLATLERTPRGTRALDLGCGHGGLGLGALMAAGEGAATLVDSNARAVDLAVGNAKRNGLKGATALLRADCEGLPPGSFDLALANPPYFADFRIAEAFVGAARYALRRGGELRLVAKAAEEHAAIVRHVFGSAEIVPAGEYGIVTARVL
jgi:16S rRNA G1207 methylase RsmC